MYFRKSKLEKKMKGKRFILTLQNQSEREKKIEVPKNYYCVSQ